MSNPFELIEARLDKIESLLLSITEIAPQKTLEAENEELLTVQQAAAFLSLSVPTIYGLISRRELPVMKRAKRCYFLRSDLIAYLKEGKQKTNAEIRAAADQHLKSKGK
ncbi:MAG: helix-turn-helix domain-containing protein [Bacteroidetes bacterium]|nr:helix-turn-helix domain-containing protein [Bacteroidota bacterium]